MEQELQIFGGAQVDMAEVTLTGQIAESSKKTYEYDISVFRHWLEVNQYQLGDLTYEHIVAYRDYLTKRTYVSQEKQRLYAKSTVSRLLTVARSILREATRRKMIPSNPADGVKGFRLDDVSPRRALTHTECEQLLDAIDRTTPKGKRDYALLQLLIRTGIRRSEIVALDITDLGSEGGHYIATIRHGKGDKRRIVKLPNDVYFAIQQYIIERGDVSPDAPLFVGMVKSHVKGFGTWRDHRIHMYGGLGSIILERAAVIGIHLTPHDLRATFATLALEKAPLHKVQYAMGHKDSRTTERYDKKQTNLDDNAVDYIHL